MFILGISLASVGLGLIIGAVIGSDYYSSVSFAVMLIVGAALIAAGAAMTVNVVRRKNRQDEEARRRNTLEGGRMAGVCPNCGLNVAQGTKVCPACKTDLTKQ